MSSQMADWAALAAALEHFEAEQLTEAEAACREILQRAPDDFGHCACSVPCASSKGNSPSHSTRWRRRGRRGRRMMSLPIAHLCGALGRLMWVMLAFSADAKWLLNRSDSPWYPTARLFRQKRLKNWDGVVAEVERALAQASVLERQPDVILR